jgi:hypothetical protein
MSNWESVFVDIQKESISVQSKLANKWTAHKKSMRKIWNTPNSVWFTNIVCSYLTIFCSIIQLRWLINYICKIEHSKCSQRCSKHCDSSDLDKFANHQIDIWLCWFSNVCSVFQPSFTSVSVLHCQWIQLQKFSNSLLLHWWS